LARSRLCDVIILTLCDVKGLFCHSELFATKRSSENQVTVGVLLVASKSSTHSAFRSEIFSSQTLRCYDVRKTPGAQQCHADATLMFPAGEIDTVYGCCSGFFQGLRHNVTVIRQTLCAMHACSVFLLREKLPLISEVPLESSLSMNIFFDYRDHRLLSST